MTTKNLMLWLNMVIGLLSYAQETYTIEGFVVDASTNLPIEGATIIATKHLYSVSSVKGTFVIEGVRKGDYVLEVSFLGYAQASIPVSVERDLKDLIVVLSPTSTDLEEVQVFGKSKKEKSKESPMTTIEASKAFMKANRENSLMQTLSKVPGVSSINIGSGQSKPVVRGLGFNRVSVVQYGVKHEAQQWGNDHGLEIDQYGIEHIQVIKGPASLMYGSDAIAGVIDIQLPKIPQQNSFNGDTNLLFETNNDLLGITTGIEARNDKWFYRGRVTYRDYADYKVPTDKISYDSYIFELDDNRLRNTAGNEINAAFSIGYIGDVFKSETFFTNVYAKNGFFANAHGLEVRTSTIDYEASNRDIDLPYHKVNHFKILNNSTFYKDKHTLGIELGFQNNYREEHSEPVPHGYMPQPNGSKERAFNKSTFTLNAKDNYAFSDKHDLVVGINSELQNNTIGGWGFLIPKYNRFTLGAFIYDHFKLSKKWHLQGGIRYDFGLIKTKAYFDWYPSTLNNADGSTSYVYLQRAKDKTLDFGSVSGVVGVSFISDNTTYKLNVGKSFRMPLSNELASDGVNYHMYRYEQGNANLNPEESYQLDIDIAYSKNQLSIGISPFVNLFENFIYLNPTPNYYETLQIYEYTQSKVFRMGGELSLGYALTEHFRINASAEYVYSKQTNGPKKDFTLPFSPPLSGLISAQYQFKNKLWLFEKLKVVADCKIVDDQNEIVPPEEKTKGYQILNLSLMSHLDLFNSEKQIQMRLKINNLFNTKYFNHTSFYRLIDVPEAGRNISVSLTIPF